MKKRLVWLVIIVAIALVGLAFWSLPFFVAKSQSAVQRNQSVSSISRDEFASEIQAGIDLTCVVVGDSDVADALRQRLARDLEANPWTGKVTMIETPVDQVDGAYLFVEVQSVDRIWTAFYAHSQTKLQVSFSLDGDMLWRNAPSVALSAERRMTAKADVQVDDTSWGLLSRRGYAGLIAKSSSEAVVEGLEQALQGQ